MENQQQNNQSIQTRPTENFTPSPVNKNEVEGLPASQPKPNRKLVVAAIIAAILLFVLIAGGICWWQKDNIDKLIFGEEQKACTLEAKLCPDGSTVGRAGPNCEFASCPAEEPLCDLDKEYELTAVNSIECICPDGYEFKTVEMYWGPCPEPGMSDCPASKQKCILQESACQNLCGDDVCQETVCLAIGCPCAESTESCPQDCVKGACVKEGEMCGGIAGIQCCSGLTCQLQGNYPDASGTCVREQIKNWQIYRNEEHGFEVKYPTVLALSIQEVKIGVLV